MGQDVKEAMTSTFHYGSIKIAAIIVAKLLKELSTFHYGSIKISIFAKRKPNSSEIYIPLWFY